jgi:hypothetical protein
MLIDCQVWVWQVPENRMFPWKSMVVFSTMLSAAALACDKATGPNDADLMAYSRESPQDSMFLNPIRMQEVG